MTETAGTCCPDGRTGTQDLLRNPRSNRSHVIAILSVSHAGSVRGVFFLSMPKVQTSGIEGEKREKNCSEIGPE